MTTTTAAMFTSISGKTTGQQIETLQQRIADRKTELAQELTRSTTEGFYFTSENIAKAANDIAGLEGELEVIHLLNRLEANDAPVAVATRALLNEALRGAQDTWSGRGNDVKRAFADGRRDAVDNATYSLS